MRILVVVSLALLLSGCGHDHAKPEATQAQADKIKAERAKLSEADRQLVEEQEYCAVETKHHLGYMGPPYKVMVKDQPVFLCCKGCEADALKDPEATLAKVAELKEKAKKK